MRIKMIYRMSILIMVVVLCVIGLERVNANNEFKQKKGTKENPYLINNVDDLLSFAQSVNKGYSYKDEFVLQTNDIDLEGVEWETIGPYDSEYSFMGTYNGDGHLIKNLSVNVGGVIHFSESWVEQ